MTDRFSRILTINSGSSSIKFSLYEMGQAEARKLAGEAERIRQEGGCFHVKDAENRTLTQKYVDLPDHTRALKILLEWLWDKGFGHNLDAVGHRVVHGGPDYTSPQWVTEILMARLKRLLRLAPEHLPHELAAIDALRLYDSGMRQVVCFDTAFHRGMPRVAQLYALPRELWDEGVMRYGFHGISCEYILDELASEAGSGVAEGRIIIAHLGHGCSMTATHERRCLDTTMGLTPTGGLVMSTRSGDLDPGVVLYLLQEKDMQPPELSEVLNRKAGLLGISKNGNDMRNLLRHEKEDQYAALAVRLFCYQARKFLGALTTVLAGVDTLVFTGGIGENAPPIRSHICENLEFLGVSLDSQRNEGNAPIISSDRSAVTVRVMKTNEELMIARHTHKLLSGQGKVRQRERRTEEW